MEDHPKKDDRRQQIIYDPAVGLTMAWTDPPDPISTPDEATPGKEEMARRLEVLATSGGWVFLN